MLYAIELPHNNELNCNPGIKKPMQFDSKDIEDLYSPHPCLPCFICSQWHCSLHNILWFLVYTAILWGRMQRFIQLVQYVQLSQVPHQSCIVHQNTLIGKETRATVFLADCQWQQLSRHEHILQFHATLTQFGHNIHLIIGIKKWMATV